MGMDYSDLYNRLMPNQNLAMSGVAPDWTQLAMQFGFIPNAFPAAGTEGQQEMRFLAALKNMMDNQLGGANGRYAQVSPGNPIAGMPYAMRQMLSSAAPLMTGPQGAMLMPQGQADMFSGGYQFGPLDVSRPSDFQNILAAQRGTGATPSAIGGTQPALPSPSSQTPESAISPPGTSTEASVAGENTPEQTPPAIPVSNGPESTTTAQEDLVSGLKQNEVPPWRFDVERKGDTLYKKGSNVEVAYFENGAWHQTPDQKRNSESIISSNAIPEAVGQKFSDLGTAINAIRNGINDWDTNAKMALADAIRGMGR